LQGRALTPGHQRDTVCGQQTAEQLGSSEALGFHQAAADGQDQLIAAMATTEGDTTQLALPQANRRIGGTEAKQQRSLIGEGRIRGHHHIGDRERLLQAQGTDQLPEGAGGTNLQIATLLAQPQVGFETGKRGGHGRTDGDP